MARDVPLGFLARLATRTTTTCLCWRIVREDNVTMGFTDHDAPVTFGGLAYEASTSFVGSAIESQIGLAVSNLEAMGAIDSESVTEDDLEDGRYDNATLTIFLVDWADDPETNNVILIEGLLGQVNIGDLGFQAEVRSRAQNFQQYVGALCSQKCRSDLFDTTGGLEGGCNFPEPPPVAGVIASVTDRATFAVTASGSFPNGTRGSLSGGFFSFGSITFTSGANEGVSVEINDNDPTLNITTVVPLPDEIAIGDTVELQIGCDKTMPVCVINYENGDNFRAEPYVPGKDTIFRVIAEGGL